MASPTLRRTLLGLVPALPFALLFGACGQQPVSLGLVMRVPQGLLDQATSVTLSVFDATLAACDPTTGHVSATPASAQVFPLSNTGCANGDQWCATIELDKDGSNKMFAVVATTASITIAEGCATKIIDQDPLLVDIQAHRYAPPRCCNDGKLEPGEQCDTGVVATCDPSNPPNACNPADQSTGGIPDDPVCFCDCTAKEILLSVDDASLPDLKNGSPGSKTSLALSFGPGGSSNPEMLRAVYESHEATYNLHASFLGADLYPIKDPVPLSLQLEFPVLCSDVTSAAGTPRDQRYPALVTAASDTVVTVYQTDQNSISNDWDVYLNPQTPDGCTDQKPCTKGSDCQTSCNASAQACAPTIQVNTVTGGATDPRIAAGPAGTVLITWTRTDGIYGRIWRTDGTLVPPMGEISIAPTGSAARVAGNVNGFVVAYQGQGPGDPTGVFIRTVDPTGKVSGDVRVNTITDGVQDEPDVAMLEDGSTLVVFHSAADIWFQRYDASGNAVADDQSAPLNTTGANDSTDQQHPAVAGANGYFVVAWETPDPSGSTTNIAARFVGAKTGFGYNSVTGQNDEFPATDPQTMGDRHFPAVAMSSFTAIGWEDHSQGHPGVYVRRFPPPAM
jgi:hypothetical protein